MNSILFFTYPFGIMLVLVLVFGLGFFLTRRYQLGWRMYWIGSALLVISQILHIPFNILVDRLIRNGSLPSPPENYQLLFSAIFLGLSSGLFEEVTRYAGMRWWAKDARSWAKGLLFGSGWGGMEAIIFFAIPLLLNYIIFMALRTQDLSGLLPPEQLLLLQNSLGLFWGVTWYDSLLGALERMLVIPIQIAMTILILQVFMRSQSRWLWLAIAWHALLDAIAVASVRLWGAYATEGILAIFTLISIGVIFALKGEEPIEKDVEYKVNEFDEPGLVDLPPIEENPQNIDQTRFTD